MSGFILTIYLYKYVSDIQILSFKRFVKDDKKKEDFKHVRNDEVSKKINNNLTDSQIEQIEQIKLRLNNSVNDFQIIRWLNQFEYQDWDTALLVLSNLDHFSSSRISQTLNYGLFIICSIIEEKEEKEEKRLMGKGVNDVIIRARLRHERKLKKHGKNRAFIHPVGEYGKSGSVMAYYVTHTPQYRNNNYFTLIKNPNDIYLKNIDNDLYLVLTDDIIGTGDSFIKYFTEFVEPVLKSKAIKKVTIYLLCVIYFRKAELNIKSTLKDYKVKIIGTKRIEAFSNSGSPFGYRPSMLRVREVCYKYGEELYITKDFSEGVVSEKKNPLGYKNSQSLVVFEHTTPNNTLPIIWSDANGWRPLFPRSIKQKIKDIEEEKNQARIWISLAKKELGIESVLGLGKDIYRTENIQLICYFKLLNKGLSAISISQHLNLTQIDLEKIIKLGIKKKLLLNDRELSDYGKELYKNLLVKAKRKQKEVIIKQSDIIYIPKTFRGRS